MPRIHWKLFVFVMFLWGKAISQDFIVRSNVITSVNSSIIQKNIWSVFNNQAGLGYINNINVGLSYENRFLLKELSTQKIALSYPFSFATAALSFASFGFENYNENSVGIGFGKKFGKYLSAGLQVNYLWRHIAENYVNRGKLLFEFGLLAEPEEGIIIGMHVFNPFFTALSENEKKNTSVTYSLGVGIRKLKNLFMVLEISGDIKHRLCFILRLDYKLADRVFLLTGIQTDPVTNFFAARFKMKKLSFDIGFCTHPVLGLSPKICLAWNF